MNRSTLYRPKAPEVTEALKPYSLLSHLKTTLFVSSLVLLTACGGGGSGSSPSGEASDTNQNDSTSQGNSTDQGNSTNQDNTSDAATALDLNTLFFTSYGEGEDTSGNVEISADGTQLVMSGNRWQKVNQNITITPDTVLEFDFQSDAEGEIHAIGFDTDNSPSADRSFQIFGSENWGITGAYQYSGLQTEHVTIPVGEYFTGEFNRMVFINDEDNASPQSNSRFSNIALRNAELSSATTVLAYENFNDLQAPDGWTTGAQQGAQLSFENGYAAGQYPIPTGESYIWFNKYLIEEQLSEVFVQFKARMPNATHGLKFLKIFGENVNGGYADVTYGLDYTGIDNGSLYSVSFGDGSTVTNDTQNIITLSGTSPELIGRSYGSAMVKTPQNQAFSSTDWGSEWHIFKMHFKFNSGSTAENEVANGEIYLEIDNKVYVDAKGVFNRHYSNSSYIDHLGLFGWSQGGSESFNIDYDDVIISKDGFTNP